MRVVNNDKLIITTTNSTFWLTNTTKKLDDLDFFSSEGTSRVYNEAETVADLSSLSSNHILVLL